MSELLRKENHVDVCVVGGGLAGSSSVPAHVEMMGLIGMGNNPMVGATVAVAVAVEKALNK